MIACVRAGLPSISLKFTFIPAISNNIFTSSSFLPISINLFLIATVSAVSPNKF